MFETTRLQNLAGLNPDQSKVYMSCMELGPSTVTEIAKHAQTKRPTTYLILDSLIILGLVSIRKMGERKKLYSAEHPKRLQQILQLKLKQTQDILPQLEAIYYKPKQKPTIKLLEGRMGVRQIYDEMFETLSEGKEVLAFSNIESLQSKFPDYLEQYIAVLRKKQRYKIKELNILNDTTKTYVKRIWGLKGKNHELRFFPEHVEFHSVDSIIYEDKVAFFSFYQQVYVLLIQDKNIVESHRALFYQAWSTGLPAEQFI